MVSPFEEGNPAAKIAFVGEAPSNLEMKNGRPFVGPAGQLFNRLLHSAGIIRASCYITNAFDYQVRKDKLGNIYDRDGGLLYHHNKGLTGHGRAEGEGALRRLRSCDANVIVPLGNAALDLLYGDTRIGKWRGSQLSSVALDGRKLLPTFHPATLLYGNSIAQYFIQRDFTRAKQHAEFPELRVPPRELIINPDFNTTRDFMRAVRSEPRIATDIEALGRSVSCFCITPNPLLSFCVPIIDEHGGPRWTVEQEAEIWRLYAEIMADERIEKINQNIVFDLTFLAEQHGVRAKGPLNDPMVAHSIMYPDFPKGLDFLCSFYTEEPYYKDDGKLWKRPWKDIHAFWRYNALDGAVALEAWDGMRSELEDEGWLSQYQDTIAMIEPLMYMMMRGMRVDREALAAENARVRAKLEGIRASISRVVPDVKNPASSKQWKDHFYGPAPGLGLPAYKDRKTGNPTTNDTALSRIIRRWNLPQARLLQEFRALDKLLGTYLEIQFDKDGRLRCSYNIRGTKTGRLSSSQTIFGTGANMQNLEASFRGFLVADEEDDDGDTNGVLQDAMEGRILLGDLPGRQDDRHGAYAGEGE